MRKFETFFNVLTTIRSIVRNRKDKGLKKKIGDSIKNNRTLTVNQTIRVLNILGNTRVANELQAVYTVLKADIVEARINRGSVRTDAVDLTELTNLYRNEVMKNKKYRNIIGRTLSKVGNNG